ncbi:hypothetical protein EU527_09340 [Candidatus Thorarchaeota archaeon]|nr:MAG: hypothetical protein EU527_09340 [Candidatus Thorarchaeota archaeon]
MEESEQMPDAPQVIRVYGTSVSSIKKDMETITGVTIGKKNVYTKETGRVTVTPEIFTTNTCCTTGGDFGGGSSEGILFCLLIAVVIMALVAIVWAIVMIAFSILTIGGFLKRRYRTLLVIERPNREFLGKLVVAITRRGGVVEYSWGIEEYDHWMKRIFSLHMRLKNLRQVSLFLAFSWGFIEIWYKLNNILYGIDYNLWPFRFVMISIFLPLLFYGTFLEFKFNSVHDEGQELIMHLLIDNPSFNPEHSMMFEEPPQIIGGMSTTEITKLKNPPKDR